MSFKNPKGGMMFKKRFFTVLIAALILGNALIAHAQKSDLFLGGDTNDQIIGESVKTNLGSFGFLLTGFLPEDRVAVYKDVITVDYDEGTAPYMCPEKGDRIISVNGIQIQDMAHFSQVIRNANTRITFKLIDRRTGKIMNLMTDLNPKGSYTRLGITVVDDNRGGVRVIDVDAGSPGSRCRYLDYGNNSGENNNTTSSSYMCPEKGDRIISVNGIVIQDMAHFSQIIRSANTRITFKLIDRRTGKVMNLMTDLNPKGSYTRLGITVVDDNRGGVRVIDVDAGSPGSRCRYLKNDDDDESGNDDDDEGGFDNDSSIMCPEKGDRILSVNGIKIQNIAHFSQIIRNADTRITFKLLDRRTGRIMNMMTDLNPKGSYTRLGISVVDDNRDGVRVIGVDAGSPGSRCRYLMYDD
ncbi:MAG: hypothetical protein IJQ39_05270 [Thermoguttaceae bacterium]|nr:hypothetical protein [Thermoguttaceae bacterium]